MRLNKYISENTINDYISLIKRDCKPWLSATKNCSDLFFRGMKTPIDSDPFIKKKVRSNRKPMNASREEQRALDFGFQKEFGWKPRSNGVFITSSITEAQTYGHAYFFFAIGDFKYVWSPWVVDLFTDLPILRSELRRKLKSKLKTVSTLDDSLIDKIPEIFYIDKNICRSVLKGNEVVVNCKTYYLLSTTVLDGKWEQMKKGIKKLLY